jgi:hypothetical protein
MIVRLQPNVGLANPLPQEAERVKRLTKQAGAKYPSAINPSDG